MRLKILAAAAAIASAPAAAHAADQATSNDLRCIVVAGAMSSAGGEQMQGVAMMTAIYYLGKLDGRTPNLNLEDSVIDQVMTLTPDQIRAEARRCGEELSVRGKALAEIGKRIQERSKTLKPDPSVPN